MSDETLAGRRILVVDDEEVIVESCRAVLERQGCLVDGELQGARGRERALRGGYDLVLLDVRLPDADGLELLRKFKQIHADTEVIVVTGHGSVVKAVEAMKAGAHSFVLINS